MRMDMPEKTIVAFPSELGWMALIGAEDVVLQLVFGHNSPQAAIRALDAELADDARIGQGHQQLAERLQAFAAGERVDFADVRIDLGPQTDFQRRVVKHCRRIPFGRTLTYGELARRAGSPRAARAVGNTMATNRTPLIVPCHRVVPASAGVGRYSAGEGTRTKLRLLEAEARTHGNAERHRPRHGLRVFRPV